jgi:heme oxygenase
MGLKEATHDKHKQAERMPFNVRMFKGELSEKEYLHYLWQQMTIFGTLEVERLPHPSLSRVDAVKKDMDELLSKNVDDLSFVQLEPIESTKNYVDYLNELDHDDLLPHIYLHYLALMFGGQMMKSKVPSTGHMYDFDNMREAAQSIRELQIDEWADEVNKGFDYMIQIFDELERVHNPS